ncbi:MAG: hypothetical protein AAF997_16965 [Myxococcota bacterium]
MKPYLFPFFLAACLLFASSCSDDTEGGDTEPPPDPEPPAETPADFTERGPLEVAVTTTSLTDSSRDRTLALEVWYPTEDAGDASAVLDFAVGSDQAQALGPLLEAAPSDCVATSTGATRDASPLEGSYPVVFYSHCYTCTRWSAHAVMERLASHGFVVVAPDHTSDTLFDRLEVDFPPLDADLVALRIADVRFVIDEVLDGGVLPSGVAADAARLGMLGHSLGSVTSGGVAEQDDRISAVAGLAAPMENPLTPGVDIEAINVPLALLLATEDNSIGLAGNVVLQANFENANPPAYRLDLIDGGHWSVTNIAGIDTAYEPGCGDGTRQESGEPFTYLDVDRANDLTATFVTAFFVAHLNEDDAGFDLLDESAWSDDAVFEARE